MSLQEAYLSARMSDVELQEASDEALFRQFLDHEDDEAFKMLADRFGAFLTGMLCNMLDNFHDAEDVLQETWIKVVAHGRSYSGEKPLRRWVASIAANAARTHYRRFAVRVKNLPEADADVDLDWLTEDRRRNPSSPSAETAELCEKVRDSRGQLAVHLQDVFDLILAGKEYREMAAELHVPVGTIRSRVHAVKDCVREIFLDISA